MSDVVTCICGESHDRGLVAQCPTCGVDLWSVESSSAPSAPAAPSVLTVEVNGRPFTIADGESVGLGRSEDYPHSEYFAKTDNVSRRHAVLRFEGGRLFVTDTGSANKTFINERELPPDTEFEVGRDQRLRLAADVPLRLTFPDTGSSPRPGGSGPTRLEN